MATIEMKTTYPQLSEWSVAQGTNLQRPNSGIISKENNVDLNNTLADGNKQNFTNFDKTK